MLLYAFQDVFLGGFFVALFVFFSPSCTVGSVIIGEI